MASRDTSFRANMARAKQIRANALMKVAAVAEEKDYEIRLSCLMCHMDEPHSHTCSIELDDIMEHVENEERGMGILQSADPSVERVVKDGVVVYMIMVTAMGMCV